MAAVTVLARTVDIASLPLTHVCSCDDIQWLTSLSPLGLEKIQTWISHRSDTDRCEIKSGFYVWLVFGERGERKRERNVQS